MTKATCILGIDPGIYGAFALYDVVKNGVVTVQDMPLRKSGVKTRNELDLFTFASTIESLGHNIRFCVVEDVHSMPNDGPVGAFSFGKTVGATLGILAANYLPVHLAKPAVWKSIMGLNNEKQNSIALATKLFPKEAHRWARKMDDGRAEALLLAIFGARSFARTAG